MAEKKVTLETEDRKRHFFKVAERSGEFWIYRVNNSFMGIDKKLGEAESLEDALSLIKTSVSGAIRNIDID